MNVRPESVFDADDADITGSGFNVRSMIPND